MQDKALPDAYKSDDETQDRLDMSVGQQQGTDNEDDSHSPLPSLRFIVIAIGIVAVSVTVTITTTATPRALVKHSQSFQADYYPLPNPNPASSLATLGTPPAVSKGAK
ncbi:uncharacterized protein TRIVIDRAFT_229337 [Trichoderma virens Gv29-8]|uniref:Uncharacterized protein n=1 Tax=Hypocrea virens (strain Gv29-8 / FGSC 10586) TaxID=413071 RepID=G9MI14_HYPVG|nr:uncharacterized protein TRIVIDRAFT_229337 [Trichoderma virens Gv29-8]EHK26349.1 hypothetical protein TRIVIDRAFT_229337 [Trichoderma virens Gv29-8]UKZ46530.1 hypothetical protein TrVGV298_000735 [Trichoderma virens]UKZ73116.1 hypothetical protein TrVFT333_000757 [Trichoderma virens FT-333]